MSPNGIDAMWETVATSTGDGHAYQEYTGPIDKPDLDNRDYRILRLDNGLKVVLIHDPTADKAAACVNVAVGHMQDPFEVPGLAHFCEHMIMKGSSRFPGENEYTSFISSNGGTKNAATGAEDKNFWFSINLPQFSTALTMLAVFFHSPLFTASLTSREMYAVDSENKRNLQNDVRRIHQLAKSLSVPGHPWTKFGTGNVESLTEAARNMLNEQGVEYEMGHAPEGDGGPIGRAVRQRLLEWWEKEYCAGRMALAVISNDPLERLVVPLFSKVPNRGLDPRPKTTEPAWGPDQKGTIVFVKTIKDYYEFRLTFHIPDQFPLYKTRPASYIAHFLGHEGEGSVYAYLKKRGYLIDISAGSSSSHNRSIHTFEVSGKLTREGYLHYKEVISTIFDYIALLRASTFDPYHSNEIAKMSELSFRFQEKGQPAAEVKMLSYNLLSEFHPPQLLLSQGSLNREWDEKAVREVLDVMRPELGRVILAAKEHDLLVVGEDLDWQAERWYGTQYAIKRLDDDPVNEVNEDNNQELFLPAPNQYIPENLEVPKPQVEQPAEAPALLRQTESYTIWHKKDDQFRVPKARIILSLLSPLAYTTPRHAVLTRLVADLLEDSLSEVTYSARLAGLNYSATNCKTGLQVSFAGYSDKLSLFVNTVIEALTTFVVKGSRLEVIVEKLDRAYRNYYMGQPSNLAIDFTADLLTPIQWSAEQKRAELQHITASDVDLHRRQLLSRVHLQTLFTGNIDADACSRLVESVEKAIAFRALTPSEHPVERSLIIPSGSNYVVSKTHTDPKEKNSAISYYCQFGDLTNTRLRSILRLLEHMIKEPAFNQLRTVEQLGYVVATPLWTSVGSMGLGFKIQSLKHPTYLEERVDAFIVSYRQTLSTVNHDEFEFYKEGLVLKLLEAPKNLREETDLFWHHIEQGYHDFLRGKNDAAIIKGLELQDVLEAYDTFILPASKDRRKLSLHLVSQQVDEASASKLEGVSMVQDETLFKRSLACSSAAVPVNIIERAVVGGILSGRGSHPDEARISSRCLRQRNVTVS